MSLDVAIHNGLEAVDQAFSQLMNELTGNASAEDRDTWPEKRNAATAYLGGTPEPDDAALIVTAATLRGVDPVAFSQEIIEKATQFKHLIGLADGLKGRAREMVRAATTEAEVRDALDAMEAQAFAAIAQMEGA
ncbi:MAG: hypothetical protein AB8B85_05465 [Paracoccaceae bacterium]